MCVLLLAFSGRKALELGMGMGVEEEEGIIGNC
jgi:hypothetical protein